MFPPSASAMEPKQLGKAWNETKAAKHVYKMTMQKIYDIEKNKSLRAMFLEQFYEKKYS